MLYSAVDRLPQTLKHTLASLQHQTGWSFAVIAGGPSPKLDGALQSFSFVVLLFHWDLLLITVSSLFRGVTKDTEEEFDMTVEDWDNAVVEPWAQFLQRVYRTYAILF